MDLKQERSCNNSNKRQDKEDRPSPVVSFMDGIERPTQDSTGSNHQDQPDTCNQGRASPIKA